MCLTVLADQNGVIDFLGENIQITLENGYIQTREVYDVFISHPPAVRHLTVLCLSPHNLLDEHGTLRVEFQRTPGALGPDDFGFYSRQIGTACNYAPVGGGLFEVEINVPIDHQVTPKVYGGRIPRHVEIRVPPTIAGSAGAIAFLKGRGTLFELAIDMPEELPQSGPEGHTRTGLAFRIVLTPTTLIGLPERIPESSLMADGADRHFLQYATVTDPKTCALNFHALLAAAKQSEEARPWVAIIETELQRFPYVASVLQHRVAVLLPPGCQTSESDASGSCVVKPLRPLIEPGHKPHTLVEWHGGCTLFPYDDFDALATRVWEHMLKYGTDPKSKTDITTATVGSHFHDMVSWIVDLLVALGMLNPVGVQQFVLNPAHAKTRIQWGWGTGGVLLGSVAERQAFKWTGFMCRYSLRYAYLAPDILLSLQEEKRRRARLDTITWWAFWLAIIGILATIVCTIVQMLLT